MVEKKSSKWKWILVVLIFAVIGFFGAKYFLSPGQDTAPATSEPDSIVVDSTVVEQQQTPAAQQQTPAAPAATVKTSAASDSAAAYPAPKKKAPKHERPSQKKSGRQYHYDYDEPTVRPLPRRIPLRAAAARATDRDRARILLRIELDLVF